MNLSSDIIDSQISNDCSGTYDITCLDVESNLTGYRIQCWATDAFDALISEETENRNISL